MNTGPFTHWKARLSEWIDAFPLLIFRRLFGMLMIYEMVDMIRSNFVDTFFFTTIIHIRYDFFEWLEPLPQAVMRLVPVIILVASLMLVLGKWVRISGIVFFFFYLYLLLIEKCYYNNHLYLFCLLGLLFSFTAEDKATDGGRRVPRWTLRIIQFQILIVYFYGGLAKLNPDWIIGHEPVLTILRNTYTGESGPPEILVNLLVWGGLLYDLLIPALFIIKRTRIAGVLLTVIFNTGNFFIFNLAESETIGIFPVMMIGSCVIFFSHDELRAGLSKFSFGGLSKRLQRQVKKEKGKKGIIQKLLPVRKEPFAFIIFYVAFQLLFPLRHYLIAGNVMWTGEANNFSWRMKIRAGNFENKIWVRRELGGERAEIHPIGFMNVMQYSLVSQNPVDMWKATRSLVPELEKRGVDNPIIQVSMWLGFNGRPRQLAIDSTLNLPKAKRVPYRHAEFILEEKK